MACKPKPTPAPDFRILAGNWSSEPLPHLCRACFGQLERTIADGFEVIGCRNCGATSDEPTGACFCQFRRGRYARLRCVKLEDGAIGVEEMESPEPVLPEPAPKRMTAEAFREAEQRRAREREAHQREREREQVERVRAAAILAQAVGALARREAEAERDLRPAWWASAMDAVRAADERPARRLSEGERARVRVAKRRRRTRERERMAAVVGGEL
jgi:hypothetical protein